MGEPATARGASLVRSAGRTAVLLRLLKLASMINRPMIERVANPHGLTANELKILMCLGGEGACAGHDITALMSIPPMNVSRAVASLMARGWIEPATDPTNRRRKPVRLSTEGERLYAGMTADLDRVARRLLRTLPDAELAQLDTLAARVIDQLARWPLSPVDEAGG